jgi:hypothetical protein
MIQSQMAALRRESAALSESLQRLQVASEQTKQQLQARIIVLETRMKAWEGDLLHARLSLPPWSHSDRRRCRKAGA